MILVVITKMNGLIFPFKVNEMKLYITVQYLLSFYFSSLLNIIVILIINLI